MIKNIAQGRQQVLQRKTVFMEQQFISDGELTIGQYLEKRTAKVL